jgi:GT2 family glycosyltransferase
MLSLIIPVYKNTILIEYTLEKALESLVDNSEIVVVDDHSDHETLNILSKFKKIRLIRHEQNMGNTAAYNTGAREAQGDLLVFMDSDIILNPYTLKKMRKVFTEFEKPLGAVGTLLLYPHNFTIQHAGVAFDKWTFGHIYTHRHWKSIDFKEYEERQAVTAALFACNRKTFDLVGGFDETYRDGLEDVEFCLKCKKNGLTNLFCSDIMAFHFESATRGPFKHIRRIYNNSIFFSRWADYFERDLQKYILRCLLPILDREVINSKQLIVLNYCPLPNWFELTTPFEEAGLKISEAHNKSGFVAEYDNIDLFRCLPKTFQKEDTSLLFVVDDFRQLSHNNYWFSQRKSDDLIVDRHANVILAKELNELRRED